MVDRDVDTSDGYTYTVTSALPDWTPTSCAPRRPRSPTRSPSATLPCPATSRAPRGDWRTSSRAGAATPYDKARALQDYLRSDRSPTTQNVGPGHGDDALITFLFGRPGGATASSSRPRSPPWPATVGLPARVAVGFTSGHHRTPTTQPVPGARRCTPTPGPRSTSASTAGCRSSRRPAAGRPGAEDWLGIPPGQDTSAGGVGRPRGPTAATGRAPATARATSRHQATTSACPSGSARRTPTGAGASDEDDESACSPSPSATASGRSGPRRCGLPAARAAGDGRPARRPPAPGHHARGPGRATCGARRTDQAERCRRPAARRR